ncbi:hypothetical protein FGO68_gene3710 [Halteria grandinella]|uniref:Uncharacterized protein n=1 Tax=Halteria grandinella TaxID=5974 RepID=A0A8J8NPI4_HALGN|nr:hypothetical protein FGO68_gene3710 [Halteria grandinella]
MSSTSLTLISFVYNNQSSIGQAHGSIILSFPTQDPSFIQQYSPQLLNINSSLTRQSTIFISLLKNYNFKLQCLPIKKQQAPVPHRNPRPSRARKIRNSWTSWQK